MNDPVNISRHSQIILNHTCSTCCVQAIDNTFALWWSSILCICTFVSQYTKCVIGIYCPICYRSVNMYLHPRVDIRLRPYNDSYLITDIANMNKWHQSLIFRLVTVWDWLLEVQYTDKAESHQTVVYATYYTVNYNECPSPPVLQWMLFSIFFRFRSIEIEHL